MKEKRGGWYSYDKMLIEWFKVGQMAARSVHLDQEPNIFPHGPPTQSLNTQSQSTFGPCTT